MENVIIYDYNIPLKDILKSVYISCLTDNDIYKINKMIFEEYYNKPTKDRFLDVDFITATKYGFLDADELIYKLKINNIRMIKLYTEFYQNYTVHDLIIWYKTYTGLCPTLDDPIKYIRIYDYMDIKNLCDILWDGLRNPFVKIYISTKDYNHLNKLHKRTRKL